jgi:hypothetical protein
MIEVAVEHDLTLWFENDVPTRMFYANRRWRITDMPTRIRDSVWSIRPGTGRGFYGWRFQATDEAENTYVFDVYPDAEGWHVHHTYA